MTTGPLHVRVARRTDEAEGIAGFELVAVDGSALPAFEAGAHVDVDIPGIGLRQYSLCNAPHETHRYCIGVLRDPVTRGGSGAMHDVVQAGASLAISTPRNRFALDETAQHSLLLAGGIGVTPLLAMAERLHAIGASFALHYATRSASRAAFLQRLRASPFADRVHVHHDDGHEAQRFDLARCLASQPDRSHLYVCGPTGFLDAVRTAARDAGWSDACVHFESFGGGPVHSVDDGAFEVVLHRSGRVIHVARGQTIVEALDAEGVVVPVSCQQGVCGTCLTRVLDGTIDHKDLYLMPDEQAANDQMLPCCSRARSPRLVLDL